MLWNLEEKDTMESYKFQNVIIIFFNNFLKSINSIGFLYNNKYLAIGLK